VLLYDAITNYFEILVGDVRVQVTVVLAFNKVGHIRIRGNRVFRHDVVDIGDTDLGIYVVSEDRGSPTNKDVELIAAVKLFPGPVGNFVLVTDAWSTSPKTVTSQPLLPISRER
jgi:hypothetical protein